MSWLAPPTVVAGQLMVAPFWNAAVRDNALALRAGGIAMALQGAGHLVVAASSTQWEPLAGVEAGVPYRTGGVWSVQSLGALVWPIGSIYESAVSTNPATLMGFGTWQAFGAGRTLVGIDAGQTEFDVPEETSGSKTVTLTATQLPVHNHTITDPGHSHLTGTAGDNSGPDTARRMSHNYPGTDGNLTTGNTGIGLTLTDAGGGGAHNNMSPYITCYRFKRIA